MKILSALLSLVLLFSSMNLSVIRHFCGGRVAEVKLAILGDASCGMDKVNGVCAPNLSCTTTDSFSKKPCCEDELTQLSVTDNYKPSINNRLPDLQLFLVAFHSTCVLFQQKGFTTTVSNYKAPPDSHSVSLSFIRVFLV